MSARKVGGEREKGAKRRRRGGEREEGEEKVMTWQQNKSRECTLKNDVKISLAIRSSHR